MRVTAFIICCVLLSSAALATDTISVKKDPRLDVLTAKQAAINKITSRMTSSGLYKGYRLQVLNTRNREEAFKMKADLLRQYPNHKTYTIFQSPYFKIRFGNFPERAEAERYKKELSLLYPQGIYVIEDGIEYTPPEADSTSDN
ncbi:SPOR domain-containing protein [Foetidibacter luteolus]|uniref:SPOR domain-containing protein n=1 Tax=Foetidibacter luteolus TaxID=2608880 RepID=UPI00129B5714|nr:SPOR domain-containing protein [Foetidibacter luteolus]